VVSVVSSGFCLRGCLCSPHFLQLSSHSWRYGSSSFRTASAALLHNSLGSLHPASLHSLAMNEQHSWASFLLKATLLKRTRTHSSLASTQVLRCRNWLRACSRIFWRLSSKVIVVYLAPTRVSCFIYSLLV